MLTTSELRRLVGRIRNRAHPDHIVLFGSTAKGTAAEYSDVDLLVVVDTWEPMHNRLASLKPVYATMTVRVDVHVYTPEEVEAYSRIPYHFLNTVMLTGKVLYSAPDARPLPRVGVDRTPLVSDAEPVEAGRLGRVLPSTGPGSGTIEASDLRPNAEPVEAPTRSNRELHSNDSGSGLVEAGSAVSTSA